MFSWYKFSNSRNFLTMVTTSRDMHACMASVVFSVSSWREREAVVCLQVCLWTFLIWSMVVQKNVMNGPRQIARPRIPDRRCLPTKPSRYVFLRSTVSRVCSIVVLESYSHHRKSSLQVHSAKDTLLLDCYRLWHNFHTEDLMIALQVTQKQKLSSYSLDDDSTLCGNSSDKRC